VAVSSPIPLVAPVITQVFPLMSRHIETIVKGRIACGAR
jgi:hypothetical protein